MSKLNQLARVPGQPTGASMTALTDAAELDAKIYGSLGELSAGKIVAKPIDIRQIEPDFAQPRQQIPSAVRARWNRQVDADSMADLFGAWTMAYAEEIGVPFETASQLIAAVLAGDISDNAQSLVQSSSTPERKAGVMQISLMKVTWLAASIKSEGQHDPIQIYRTGNDGYRIIDGERRWLAHCLLAETQNAEQWGRVKAFIEDRPNVWAQADKNNQREGLTAIERARQLAILLMDLYTFEGYTFQPYDAFEHDLGFYAQVSDGNEWRVPRGSAARLSAAMGNMSEDVLRKYRALLRLPAEVWTMADDLDWSENFIREIERASNNDIHLTRMASIYAREQGYTVTVVTVSDADEGQEWSDGAMLDAAAEEQFRSIVGDEPPQWDGVAVDEDGVAFDAWTDTPLGQEPSRGDFLRSHPPTAGAFPSPKTAGEEENSQVWENPWDDPAMDQKRLNLMSFAFSRARGNWFRPADVGFGFELLQALVERGELESQSPTFNKQDRSLWKFRITPKGCGVLGRTYGQWDDPQQPISRPPATYGTLPQPTVAPAKKRGGSIISKPLANLFIGLQAVDKLEADGDYDAVCQIDDQFAEFEALIAQARAPFLARRARGS